MQILQDAIASLTLKAENKTALHLAILDAKVLDTSIYTKESVETFEKALAAAQAVLNNEDATQAEVDEALKTLEAASKVLVKKADKKVLEETIKEAEVLQKELYEDFHGVETALSKGKEVMSDENATQEEVDSASKSYSRSSQRTKL